MTSCKPDEVSLSNIPVITLESVEIVSGSADKDSLIVLTIGYEDGDGDIGLTSDDIEPPYNFGSPFYHNLPVTYLVANTLGDYEELKDQDDEPYGNQHERIPVLTPTGKYKAIVGTISVKLTANPLITRPDSIKLNIALIDRALNVSNIIETKVIHLKH